MSTPLQNISDRASTFDRASVGPPAGTWNGNAPTQHAPATSPVRAGTLDGWAGIRRALVFVTLLVVVVITLDIMINAGLRRIGTSAFGVTNRMVKGQINADILITGSSRAQVHYDPRVIASITGLSTYNLGRNGSQTDMQLAVLKTYLQHNRRPRLVVHNLDLYSFVTSHEIYDPGQYVPYLDQPAIYAGVRRVYPDAWKWKFLPLYGYIVEDMRFTWLLGLKRLAGFEPAEDQVNGFVARHMHWTGDFEAFRRQSPEGIVTPVEEQGIRDLDEILAICRDHGIPAVLVYSPEYVEVQALQRNRADIFRRFAENSVRFDVPLWDFSDSAISRNRDYFYNSQHLNATGASLFSVDLARRLVREGMHAQGVFANTPASLARDGRGSNPPAAAR